MAINAYAQHLLKIAEALHRWLAALSELDAKKRAKVAVYADEIAGTLARAADALQALEVRGNDQPATRQALKEFGRICGYLETIVGVLRRHLDGRKLAGVKRRLDQLESDRAPTFLAAPISRTAIERLLTAEGYFRALADGLRA